MSGVGASRSARAVVSFIIFLFCVAVAHSGCAADEAKMQISVTFGMRRARHVLALDRPMDVLCESFAWIYAHCCFAAISQSY